MPPLLRRFLENLVTHGLQILAGFLVTHGWLTEGDAVEYVAAGASALVSYLWQLYLSWRADQDVVQALDAPAGTSLETFKAKYRE